MPGSAPLPLQGRRSKPLTTSWLWVLPAAAELKQAPPRREPVSPAGEPRGPSAARRVAAGRRACCEEGPGRPERGCQPPPQTRGLAMEGTASLLAARRPSKAAPLVAGGCFPRSGRSRLEIASAQARPQASMSAPGRFLVPDAARAQRLPWEKPPAVTGLSKLCPCGRGGISCVALPEGHRTSLALPASARQAVAPAHSHLGSCWGARSQRKGFPWGLQGGAGPAPTSPRLSGMLPAPKSRCLTPVGRISPALGCRWGGCGRGGKRFQPPRSRARLSLCPVRSDGDAGRGSQPPALAPLPLPPQAGVRHAASRGRSWEGPNPPVGTGGESRVWDKGSGVRSPWAPQRRGTSGPRCPGRGQLWSPFGGVSRSVVSFQLSGSRVRSWHRPTGA